MESKAKKIFSCYASVGLDEEQKEGARRWLNLQHTGEELVPLENKVKKELKNSHYRMNAFHNLRCDVELSKEGFFILKSIYFDGITYNVIPSNY
jgi:hypothetical protein